MLLRFGNIIYDLKYCEKIVLQNFAQFTQLYLSFIDGTDDKIDLRKYDCDPDELFEQICNNKNKDDVILRIEKKEDEKDVS